MRAGKNGSPATATLAAGAGNIGELTVDATSVRFAT